MATTRQSLTEDNLVGLKYFKPLRGLLDALHRAGCTRDRAGNRRLHMDQYVTLQVLFMFNPLCSSLRSLQRASELPKVQRTLGVGRASLGSLSEAARIFDADLLEGIIGELSEKARPVPHDARLNDLDAVLTLVDGSHLSSLSTLTQTLWSGSGPTGVKMHLHFELLKSIPTTATLTDAHGCEKQDLSQRLEAKRLYVLDRGYAKYALLQSILDAKSDFVCRVRNDAAWRSVIEDRPIENPARQAGVQRDVVVDLGTAHHRRDLTAPTRLVTVRLTPHPKRNDEEAASKTMIIATNRLDLSAEVIALIYQQRWQVELFFRFFKHVLGCRHLLSHCANGIKLQVYAAIIACLLIALYTGRKPTKATAELMGWWMLGLADESDLQRHLGRLKIQA
jgi:predicted protein tyrosine phosphatase